MGLGTIQQTARRIKARARLLWYDLCTWGEEKTASLRDWAESERGKAAAYTTILILTGVASYALGDLAGLQEVTQPATVNVSERVQYADTQPADAQVAHGKIVASKKGKRWHYTWCPGAETISEKNKRWFQSEQAAEAAGYTKASNCQ
jgi:hypothetical protein